MPALLKRIAIEVNGALGEQTSTVTSQSTDGHYISLRPLLHPTEEQGSFPFEWAFFGTNKDIEVSKVSETIDKQVFKFGFDTNVYLKVANIHEGPVSTQWETIANGVQQETGEIFPFGKDKAGVKFVEIWQPIDSNSEQFVITDGTNTSNRSIVLKIDNDEYFGMIIVVGKWVQGFLSKKNGSTASGLNSIRAFETGNGTLNTSLKFGSDFDKFPTMYDALKTGMTVDANGAVWDVIEAYY